MSFSSHPFWTPADYEQAAKDAAAGLLRESHHFEAKRSLEPGNAGKAKIDKALSAFSVDGGSFAIGVTENEHQVIDGLAPFQIGDLRERILQIAARCDPPVQPNIQVIREQDNGPTGIVLVHVPISPAAPHRAGNDVFYGRDEARSYPLSSAEVERLIRQRRTHVEDQATQLHQWAVDTGYTAVTAPWCVVMVSPWPKPSNDQVLMPRMGNDVGRWFNEMHSGTAILGQWAPTGRTATGIVSSHSYGSVQKALYLDRDGTLKYMYTDILGNIEHRDGAKPALRWPAVTDFVYSLVAISNKIWAGESASYGLRIAVELGQLQNLYPQDMFGPGEHRARVQAERDGYLPSPYRANSYCGAAEIDALTAAAEGEGLIALKHKLFSPLLNSMGLPQYTELRAWH